MFNNPMIAFAKNRQDVKPDPGSLESLESLALLAVSPPLAACNPCWERLRCDHGFGAPRLLARWRDPVGRGRRMRRRARVAWARRERWWRRWRRWRPGMRDWLRD